MEDKIEKKSNKKYIWIFIIVFCIAAFIIGFIVGNKLYDTSSTNTNETTNNVVNNTINEAIIDDNTNTVPVIDNSILNGNKLIDKEIKNADVKRLFGLVGGYLKYSVISKNNFLRAQEYSNDYSKFSTWRDVDKLNLLMSNGLVLTESGKIAQLPNSISSKDDNQYIEQYGDYYVTLDEINSSFKSVYGYIPNLNKESFGICGNSFVYNSDNDVYLKSILGGCGGSTDGVMNAYTLIYDYTEKDNTIEITAAYAYYNVIDYRQEYIVSTPNGGKWYIDKINENDFYFTDENIDRFSKLKYVFNKNSNGDYYVKDIIIL